MRSDLSKPSDGKLKPSSVNLHSADRSSIKTCGTLLLSIEIGGKSVQCVVTLVDTFAHDFILGSDFCELVGATVDHKSAMFLFDEVTVPQHTSASATASTLSNPFFEMQWQEEEPKRWRTRLLWRVKSWTMFRVNE